MDHELDPIYHREPHKLSGLPAAGERDAVTCANFKPTDSFYGVIGTLLLYLVSVNCAIKQLIAQYL